MYSWSFQPRRDLEGRAARLGVSLPAGSYRGIKIKGEQIFLTCTIDTGDRAQTHVVDGWCPARSRERLPGPRPLHPCLATLFVLPPHRSLTGVGALSFLT
jgi:hypothetical protein